MSIKLKIAIGILTMLGIIAFAVFAGPVGSTSEQWKVVITPCAWCSSTSTLEVHHVIPQAECKKIGKPELIYDTNNMVILCRTDGKGCHYYIGHHARGWDYVFTNIMQVIKMNRK